MVSGDFWYVRSSGGGVHRLTLDDLETAFQAGQVNARTMVVPEDDVRWRRLGDLAGIEIEPTTRSRPVPYSDRPVSIDSSNTYAHPARGGRGWLAALGVAALVGGLATGISLRRPVWARSVAHQAAIGAVLAKDWGANLYSYATRRASHTGPLAPIPVATLEPTAAPPPSAAVATASGMAPIAVEMLPTERTAKGAPTKQRGRTRIVAKEHAAGRIPKATSPAKADTPSIFTTGGNKYDPLNSTL
jgi:hypothetical protein